MVQGSFRFAEVADMLRTKPLRAIRRGGKAMSPADEQYRYDESPELLLVGICDDGQPSAPLTYVLAEDYEEDDFEEGEDFEDVEEDDFEDMEEEFEEDEEFESEDDDDDDLDDDMDDDDDFEDDEEEEDDYEYEDDLDYEDFDE
jgi:hypothetical protein